MGTLTYFGQSSTEEHANFNSLLIDFNCPQLVISPDNPVHQEMLAEFWDHTKYFGARTCVHLLLIYLQRLCNHQLSSNVLEAILSRYDDGGGIYMAKSNSSKPSVCAAFLQTLTGLPEELRQLVPDHFLLADSGANVHCVWDTTFVVNFTTQNRLLHWGGQGARSACIGIGQLYGCSFRVDGSQWERIVLTSGSSDTWVIPDTSQQIFSLAKAVVQGHTPELSGPTPCLILRQSTGIIPLIRGDSSIFLYLPMYPPPSSTALIYNQSHYPTRMPVVNLNAAVLEGYEPEIAWAAPLKASTRKLKLKIQRMRENGFKPTSSKATPERIAAVRRLHQKCGHLNMKKIIEFKRNNRLIATGLPPKFLRA